MVVLSNAGAHGYANNVCAGYLAAGDCSPLTVRGAGGQYGDCVHC